MRAIWALIKIGFALEFYHPASLFFFVVVPLIFTGVIASTSRDAPAPGTIPSDAPVPVVVVATEPSAALTFFQASLQANRLAPQTVMSGTTVVVHLADDFATALSAGGPVSVSVALNVADNRSPAIQQAIEAAVSHTVNAARLARVAVQEAQALGSAQTPAAQRAFFDAYLLELLKQDGVAAVQVKQTWAVADTSGQTIKRVTGNEQASAGQLVTWVQMTLLVTSAALVNERLSGTLRRLLVAPVSRSLILSGKLFARVLLGLFQMLLLFVGGALFFGVTWGSQPVAVILISVSFAFAMTGMGLLIATFMQTPAQAGNASTGVALFMAALGGAWWPLEVTPPFYQTLAHILPTTWAMSGYTKILVQNAGVAELAPEIAVLLGFSVLFFVVGAWRFRRYV